MSDTLLTIDCGTQSLRALLFSEEGVLLGKAQIEYEPYFSEAPGWAEQDPELYWNALCQTCQTLKSEFPGAFAGIKGVGVTTIRASMVNVDREGNPLRPVIVWLDQRKAKPVFTPNPLLDPILKAIGVKDQLMKSQRSGKGNWIIENQPHIWRKTHKYLQVSGFLNHRPFPG